MPKFACTITFSRNRILMMKYQVIMKRMMEPDTPADITRGTIEGQFAASPITAADQTPPSVPQGLRTSARTQTTVTLEWNASTDNIGVTGYRLYRATTQIGSS